MVAARLSPACPGSPRAEDEVLEGRHGLIIDVSQAQAAARTSSAQALSQLLKPIQKMDTQNARNTSAEDALQCLKCTALSPAAPACSVSCCQRRCSSLAIALESADGSAASGSWTWTCCRRSAAVRPSSTAPFSTATATVSLSMSTLLASAGASTWKVTTTLPPPLATSTLSGSAALRAASSSCKRFSALTMGERTALVLFGRLYDT